MATFLDPSHLTLSGVLQLTQYEEGAAFVREVEKKSKLMQILPWYPTSHGMVHKGVKATALPEGGYTSFNMAIPTGKASTVAYEHNVKMYELASKIDKRFFKNLTAEQTMKVRASMNKMYSMGFMQGLAKEIVTNDGISIDSEQGLLPKRSKLDGKLCISAGGSSGGSMGSILLVRPDMDGVNIRYPESANAGFSIEDMGRVQMHETLSGALKGDYWGYETDYSASYCLDIPDETALIRIANLPTTTALTKTEIEVIIDVVSQLDNDGQGYVAFAPQEIIGQFWKYLNDKNNIAFSKREVEGMGAPTHIFNVPLFSEDFMTATEQVIA